MRHLLATAILALCCQGYAANNQDLLIELTPRLKSSLVEFQSMTPGETKIDDLGLGGWVRIQVPSSQLKNFDLASLSQHPEVLYVQPNYRIKLLENPSLNEAQNKLAKKLIDDDCPFPESIPGLCDSPEEGLGTPALDNPEIPNGGTGGAGDDPLFSSQWGMNDIGSKQAWKVHRGSKDMVVAVIDTGVDYTHEDLVDNLWRNTKEIPNNNKDDDGNGFVDDVIGWDFVSNDNKPYDLSMSGFDLFQGGNPGHGTHCAGNVAARGLNGKGISGVAPNVKMMVLRFLSEKGQGTTADAVKAVRYAVENGAQILSNSWGSEGEDPNEAAENKALRDIIQFAQEKGSLFVAAAGNGHSGIGYDNDSDPKPAYPASYDHDIIISVAALDAQDKLGSFSNWGQKTVDIGAPGVKVFSTMVGQVYSDTVFDKYGMTITWDGTSMAAPHVAGAAALYWSKYPNKTWKEVKNALLATAKNIPSLSNKSVSDGKLNIESLMNF